jgi:hypothetical protein
LKADYADDSILSDHLEGSKSNLFDYFNANYANAIPTPPSSSPPSTRVQPTPLAGSPQKSFTARYRRKEKTSVNELEAYFKLPTEDFETCNPIHWWIGRRAQFPNLFCMARDILCIPGKFLLVSLIQVALTCLQVLLSPLRESSRVVATQYPFGALAFMPTRSEYLCLSRSGCTLRVPKPTPPCGIDSVPSADIILRSQDSHHLRVLKVFIIHNSPVLAELVQKILDSSGGDANAEVLVPRHFRWYSYQRAPSNFFTPF